LEAILAVPGVDMVQFGPGDYSVSIGVPGQWTHAAVQEAETYVIETAYRLGIPARAELRDAKGARYYLERGIRHFCVGLDVIVLHDWLTEQGQRMRDLLSGRASAEEEPADRLVY